MKQEAQKFFCYDKYFDNVEDLMKHRVEYLKSQVTEESFYYLFEMFKKNIEMNGTVYSIGNMSNKELIILFGVTSDKFCLVLMHKLSEKGKLEF
jgi:hypothetical protein